jgi:hypothetical protein
LIPFPRCVALFPAAAQLWRLAKSAADLPLRFPPPAASISLNIPAT